MVNQAIPGQVLTTIDERISRVVDVLDTAHWNIGVIDAPIGDVVSNSGDYRVEWYPRPGTSAFFADPFPATIDGAQYIFVEEYPYAEGKGKISFIEYEGGFEDETFKTAHEEPFHMSYPYLFEYDGQMYATPETADAGDLRLYRVDSPTAWKLERTVLPDVEAIDPTIIQHGDRWWLFLTRKEYANTRLEVWHADTPTGQWHPHANNPVKTDIGSARPGGTPIEADGTLYRPGQDCADGYGMRVVLNAVTELTPTRYGEQSVGTVAPVTPGQFPRSVHTLAGGNGITVIDGKSWLRNPYTLQKRATQIVTREMRQLLSGG